MLVSGRWHTQGQPIVYTAAESALTVLEVRVNLSLDFADLPLDYVLLRIDTGAAGGFIEKYVAGVFDAAM